MNDQQPQQPGWGQQHTPPPYPPPTGYAPHPPKKSNTGKIIAIVLGSIAGFFLLVGGCAALVVDGASNDIDKTDKPPAAAGQEAKGDDAASEPTPEPAEEAAPSDATRAFNEVVSWESGLAAEVTSFERGTSSQWAAPGSTPYVKFDIQLTNDGDTAFDSTLMTVQCMYGADGRMSEMIFDTENGLEGPPMVQVQPGRSVTATVGCELPEDVTEFQVELSPDFTTEPVLFAGEVK